jgi:DNA-binding XRE family transcriptional regulator
MGRNGAMLPCLAAAAKGVRNQARASTAEVANLAGVDTSTVRRFERAHSWPRDPDTLIAAYARVARCPPREIWRDAIDRWCR